MYSINDDAMRSSQYRCQRCYTVCPNKTTLNHHTSMCNFIHISSKEHAIDHYFNNIELPSQESMARYIFDLTKKYDELEQKVAKLQKSIIPLRRKQIGEYLEELPPPKKTFPEWSQSITIPDESLEVLFKHDLKFAIKHVLEDIIDNREQLPIRAFSQKPNIFYLYDTASEWRLMSPDEFIRFVEKVEFKFSKKYAEWAREHQHEIQSNEKAQEQSLVYMAKVNGVKQGSHGNRISDVKKWLYSKLAVSLKQFII